MASDYKQTASQHQDVALIPIEIEYESAGNDKSKVNDSESLERTLTKALTKFVSSKEHSNSSIEVWSLNETAVTLKSKGVVGQSFERRTNVELARSIDVDALILSRMYFQPELNVLKANLTLVDGESGGLIYSYAKTVETSNANKLEKKLQKIIKQFSRKLPY